MPVSKDTPTQELIATIGNDHDCIETFQARAVYSYRTGLNWRDHAPAIPRSVVGSTTWSAFIDSGAYTESVLG